MTTINRMVIDISHWNSTVDFAQVKAAGIYGVIHKASEGGTVIDDKYLSRAREALNLGLLWGAYHFANDTEPVQKQVDNFLSMVGVDNETLYCLDWEDNEGDTMSAAQAKEFIERLESQIGPNRTVIYSGNTAKEALGSKADPFFGARRLWLCQYGTSPTCQASWDKWWLWQYSDSKQGPGPHGCPGVSNPCDTNSWDGTIEALHAEWSGAVTVPVLKIPTVTIATTGVVRVTVNGTLVS